VTAFCERPHRPPLTAFTTDVLVVASIASRVPRASLVAEWRENSPFPARFAVFATAAGQRCTSRPRSGARATVQRAGQFVRDDHADSSRAKTRPKPAEPAFKTRENTVKNFCVFCVNSVESIGHTQIIRRCLAGATKPAGDNVCCPKSKQTSLTRVMGGAGAIWAVP
jgi:hypothetical protein